MATINRLSKASRNQFRLALAFFLTLAVSCREPEPPQPFVYERGAGFFILNEGNFQWSNASLDYVDEENDTILRDVFQTANGVPLGDVLQSISIDGNRAYLVVNNSQKIEVISLDDFKRIGTIEGLVSPRNLLIENGKGFVSDLYGNDVSVVDLETFAVNNRIPLGGWSEALYAEGERVYVSSMDRPYVYAIDAEGETLVDSAAASVGGFYMGQARSTANGFWLLSGGDPLTRQKASFRYYETEANDWGPFETINFPEDYYINDGFFNTADGYFYYLHEGAVYRMAENGTIPQSPIIPSNGQFFYGLNLDDTQQILYLADAVDYVQRGWIRRFELDGTPIDSIQAGIIPNGVVFVR